MSAHAWGDAAGDLNTQGSAALAQGDYKAAAAAFDQILSGYPNTPGIDDIRIKDGYAYIHTGDFTKAISQLASLAAKNGKPEFRGTALYFTGLAKLSQGGKLTDKAATAMFTDAAATFTELLTFIAANPTSDNQAMSEDALYNRAMANFQAAAYDAAEKDLLQLGQQYNTSLRRPDYLNLLGTLYAVETSRALGEKKATADIRAIAAKAIDAYGQVSNDPNALVQANEANLRQAEVLYLIAQLDLPDTIGYSKALDAFRKVRRKADMVPIQQDRIAKLRANSQAQVRSGAAALASSNSTLIERETGRLEDLQTGPDPIIEALLRMAECYNAMKQCDEARTILHRLTTQTSLLTADQVQEVDFQTIYSYALGGQIEKADKSLTDYLQKHPGDPQADSISYQMASNLLQRKDNEGALEQANRSLKDFPNGRYVLEVYQLKAQALNALGRAKEAQDVLREVANRPAQGAVAFQNQLNLGQSLAAQGNPQDALAAFQKVKDDPAAGPLQAVGEIYYIQTLQTLGRFDDVITESKAFAAKYATNKALPSVLVLQGVAMDQKHDPGAVTVLQDEAKRFPNEDATPFALFYVVTIYQRADKIPEMIQAAKDLATQCPTAYSMIAQASDAVSAVYLKQKQFDPAIALYQPLTAAPKTDVAAGAKNKVGDIWLAKAKSMGSYQSLQKDEDKTEARNRLASAEQSYLSVLKDNADQLEPVGDAFRGLDDLLLQRRSWGLLTDADFEDYLTKACAGLTSPEMAARVELAKAGLVFITKEGEKQYPAALDRFKKVTDANPTLALTRQETNRYGQLLIAGAAYSQAIDLYTKVLSQAAPTDVQAQADGYYGLGASYLAQGEIDKAKDNFTKMKALSGGAAWHPHIMDANYGLALAAEQAGDSATAKPLYAMLMRSPQANSLLQAKAMLGYGHLLEKEGHAVKAPNQADIEFATHYYRNIHVLFDGTTPELSAQGLFEAGQAFAKAGNTAEAKTQYGDLVKIYGQSAPDWTAKAQAELAKSGG